MDSITSCRKTLNIMELLPYLLGIDLKQCTTMKITPSMYITEMAMTTEQRLEKLKHPLRKTKWQNGTDFSSYTIIPDAVIFQNFKPGEIQSITVKILNISSVSVCLLYILLSIGKIN